MSSRATRSAYAFAVAVSMSPLPALAQAGQDPAWDSVAAVLRTSVTRAAGYQRFTMPRRDLHLRMGEIEIATSMALGTWAGFSGEPEHATVMGDLVLTTQELGPVLRELSRRDIAVTAIHNHLVGVEPEIVYVHFHASGSAVDLARRLAPAVALTGTPLPVRPAPAQPLSIDTATVFRALGPGRAQGAVAQVSLILVPGAVTIDDRDVVPGPAYGTAINVQAIDAERAVATGDFAVLRQQMDPVLDAFAAHDITATAVHTHLTGESPKVYYIHFWADGTLTAVLNGLRAAVDAAR